MASFPCSDLTHKDEDGEFFSIKFTKFGSIIGATSSDIEIRKSFLVVFGLKFIDDKEISKLFNALCIGRERSLALGVGLIPLGPLIKDHLSQDILIYLMRYS